MRDYPLTHTIAFALSVALCGTDILAGSRAPDAPTARDRRFTQVATLDGTLAPGATGLHEFRFERGREYHVVATCATACGDMTLGLFSPRGDELDRAVRPAPMPEVATIPSSDGRYRVDVTMAHCATGTCGYTLRVFAR